MIQNMIPVPGKYPVHLAHAFEFVADSIDGQFWLTAFGDVIASSDVVVILYL